MKFHIWSDLHAELLGIHCVKKMCKMYFKKDLDSSMILAGDIGKPGDRKYLYILDWCSRRYNKVFIICGNHEFYDKYSTYEQVVKNARDTCKRFANVYFLDKNIYCSDSYIIFGCTLWTDINKFELECAQKYYNDFKYIKDINALHKSDLDWLTSSLDYYKDDPRTKIILTHHMPSYQLIDTVYKNSPINSAFANTDCDEILKHVDYWIYGHTHKPRCQKVFDCTCICNPIGYKDENDYISNFVLKII